ncbi:MAG: hypothetical protein NTV23_06545 [Propionibacteriales bacterium]|nr:hypothetical protein [Propionibacteriales bacterium]
MPKRPVSKSKASSPADDKRRARIGRQVSDIVNEIVLSTADEDVEVAIDRLHTRLQRVSGMEFDRAWAKRAVETMRRGDVFKVIIP